MVALFFLVGLVIGSFLNSVIYRIEKKESFIRGRSYCPNCRKVLSWFELIPVVSFIFQKGKCRHCQKKISKQYIIVELVTGFLFALLYNFFASSADLPQGDILHLFFWLMIASCLIIIFFYDLKYYIIPDQVVYFGIIVALLGFLTLNSLLAALIAGTFFLSLVLISKGYWMGMGDVKLVIFMGLVLGWPNILAALFLAFFTGALFSIFLILAKIKTLKSKIPFGPFLVGATFVSIFFSDFLVNWYLGLLM